MAFNWTCPFCNLMQTVTSDRYQVADAPFRLMGSKDGQLGVRCAATVCSNPECLKTSIRAIVCRAGYSSGVPYITNRPEYFLDRTLVPEGTAKPQPEFIPAAIREDYYEACRIVDLSPKAAATLVRRCLQGMIRDFCGISKATLNAEITALKSTMDSGNGPSGVSAESVEAIDHIRSVGNIGAHMEKDISVIVNVDPGEAQALIDVVELLFDEWYVHRHQRKLRLERVREISTQKQTLRSLPSPDPIG